MASRALAPGDVVLAYFPQHLPPGHEQEGQRPAVVVAVPDMLGHPRYPTVVVVPVTTDHGQEWATRSPALYPRLRAGMGGLRVNSLVLLDQLRALALERVTVQVGTLSPEIFQPVRDGLRSMLG